MENWTKSKKYFSKSVDTGFLPTVAPHENAANKLAKQGAAED